ncbi:MAG: hypothetical protein ACMUJM_25910 [bacterium]
MILIDPAALLWLAADHKRPSSKAKKVPCDRFIIATALLNAMTIITSNSLIAQYEGVKVIW